MRIAIRDSGLELSAEQTLKVFEPFYTTKSKGTGLGMAIAKRMIEAHGGMIAVGDGNGDGGAEFIVTVPTGSHDSNTTRTTAESRCGSLGTYTFTTGHRSFLHGNRSKAS